MLFHFCVSGKDWESIFNAAASKVLINPDVSSAAVSPRQDFKQNEPSKVHLNRHNLISFVRSQSNSVSKSSISATGDESDESDQHESITGSQRDAESQRKITCISRPEAMYWRRCQGKLARLARQDDQIKLSLSD